jgi:hypothetical protein
MSKSLTSSAHDSIGRIAEPGSAAAPLEPSPNPTTAIVSAVDAQHTPRQDDLRVVIRRIVVSPSHFGAELAVRTVWTGQPGFTRVSNELRPDRHRGQTGLAALPSRRSCAAGIVASLSASPGLLMKDSLLPVVRPMGRVAG